MYHCISSQIVKSLYDSFLVEYCIREKCLQKTVDNIFGPCKTFVLMIPSNGLNCNKINPLHYFMKRKRKMEALNYLNEGKFKGAFILIRFWPKFICSYYKCKQRYDTNLFFKAENDKAMYHFYYCDWRSNFVWSLEM